MRRVIFSAGLLLLCTNYLSAQTFNSGLTAKNGQFIGFMEYRPADYASVAKHPMIIFLHGIGETGNGTTDLKKIHCCGIPSYIKRGHNMQFTWNGTTESFVVLMPQLHGKYGVWQSFYVNEMIDYAVENLNIDANRIFVTGLSLGGGGTWAYASESPSNAERLAGIVPVVGPCMMTNGCNIAKAALPVLAVHSRDDKTASPECTTNAIKDITGCGASSVPNLIMYPNGGHAVWLLRAYSTDHTYQDPNIYEWMLAQNKKFNPNKKPMANAGNDITITGVSTIKLNGAASTDPDGKILRYLWRRITGPGTDTIAEVGEGTATIEGLYKAGTYRYELKVVDDRAEWDTDTVNVIATVDVEDTNKVPIAFAGRDTILYLPDSVITLDGSLSTDPDGTITKYLWEPVSGPDTAYIDSARQAVTKARQFIEGDYKFRLTVSDNQGKRASDVIIINVQKRNGAANLLPVARAGNDTLVFGTSDEVLLNGSLSTDSDGSIKSYSWKKVSGGDVMIMQPGNAVTKVRLSEAGEYAFELEVIDNDDGIAKDTVSVGYNKNDSESSIVLFPNPARNSVRIFLSNEERGELTITLYDMKGSKIAARKIVKNSEKLTTELSVIQLQTGVYLVQVNGERKLGTMRLVKTR